MTKETKHYLTAIRLRLERLYEVYPNDPILRDQISDEVDWIDATLSRNGRIADNLDRYRGALQEAIDVFEGMNDDEIDVELLPRLRAALSPGRT